jgi:multiple sugar transport system ATP-binding protein
VAQVEYSGVWKRYDNEVEALRGLDLTILDEELLVLVGPSGSGKSTALRLVAGLEEVSDGTISIGSRDVTRMPPARRNVSMVFQSYALFPHLTVRDNIGFGLRARRVPRSQAAERVARAAAQVDCTPLLDRKPSQLSGGERQRVALARAIVREPAVFLLDEPLSNLDAQLRVETRAELKRIHQQVGATMIYVTHDQIEALTMGDRVAVLDRGVLQQVGSPDEVYRRPANRFVARFVGSPAMNVMPAAVVDGALHGGPFRVTAPGALEAAAGADVELGVRPEHVDIAVAGAGVPAETQVIEVAGSETFLHLAVEGREIVARVASERHPDIGALVHVGPVPAIAYLFDAGSGSTLWAGGR